MATENRTFKIDLKGISLFEDIVFVPTGVYKMEVVSAEDHISKEAKKQGVESATSLAVKLRHIDKGFASTEIIYLGLDFSEEGTRRSWKGLIRSMGVPEERTQGVATISIDSIRKTKDGKPRILFVKITTPPPNASGEIDLNGINRNFVPPEAYSPEALPEPFPAGYGRRAPKKKDGTAAVSSAAPKEEHKIDEAKDDAASGDVSGAELDLG